MGGTDAPDDPRRTDVQFAETPTGDKAHLVDFGTESMLARGTRGATNYASACGEVLDLWDQLADKPDPSDVCRRCAIAYRYRIDDAPVDREYILRASGPGDSDG